MSKYLLFLGLLCLAISACVEETHNRLTPSGKTIRVPQGKEFCKRHPEDQICSK